PAHRHGRAAPAAAAGRALLDRARRRGLARPARTRARPAAHARPAPARPGAGRVRPDTGRRRPQAAGHRGLRDADADHRALPALVRAQQRAVHDRRAALVRPPPQPPPAVDVTIERARDALTQPIEPGALPPGAAAERARLGEIGAEQRRRAIREAGVGDLLVRFQVPAKAPAVQVARADRYPLITQGHLAVQDARLILEDLDAVAQQLAVETPRRLAHPRVVGARPRHQQPHVDAAPCRAPQRLAEAP